MLDIQHICAGYGKKQILKDVSASFAKGKITAIIGPNGCGKSTLLKAASGILPLSEGTVSLDGMSLAKLQRKQVSQRIAYLEQGGAIPDMTVEQLVLHGRFPYLNYPVRYTQTDKNKASEAMERVGIGEYAKAHLTTLSGGLRQSAYLAMVLCRDAEYILLDEPSTYLDIANSLRLLELFKTLKEEQKGIVVVLHDLIFALEYSDEIVVMRNGRTELCAPPREVYDLHIIRDVFGVTLQRTESENGRCYRYES